MSRKKLIAANWKMYKTPEQTTAFFREFLPLVADHSRDEIVVCAPFVDLHAAVAAAKGSNVFVGAQNMHWEKEGAFTGEVSAPMLNAIGVTHVILGHSERREYFNETDDSVNRKLELALESGFTPIVCVGEVLEEREAGVTEDVCRRQCMRAFSGISAKKAAKAFGDDFAAGLRILYGGSVKPDNATALMSEEEIDGALVGGASLDPKNFAKIVKY